MEMDGGQCFFCTGEKMSHAIPVRERVSKKKLAQFLYGCRWANEARRKYGLKSTTRCGIRVIILFEEYYVENYR